jgi:response regulator RpfG family c-di-GMP phosphodiesterase
MSGVDFIRTVMARHRNSKFIVLTTYEDDMDIQHALEAGAHSCIIKGMPGEVLIQALRRAHLESHPGGSWQPRQIPQAYAVPTECKVQENVHRCVVDNRLQARQESWFRRGWPLRNWCICTIAYASRTALECRLRISAAHRAAEFTASASKSGEDGKQIL